MTKRIAAVIAIYFCTAFSWLVLSGTIEDRTRASQGRLGGKVQSSWGASQEQSPPTATYEHVEQHTETTEDEKGKKVSKTKDVKVSFTLPVESSKIDTGLDLEYRQKGLLWYSTYKVAFSADYVYRNSSPLPEKVWLTLGFPAAQAIYDDLQFLVDGQPVTTANGKDNVYAQVAMQPGQAVALHVAYRSQGLGSWCYHFGADVTQVRNFSLVMHTNFKDVDFPDNALSPTTKHETANGWLLTWNYKNLVSGDQIAMVLPEKLQPGPLAGQISTFAPVSLLFFFFFLLTITTIRKIELHPMNYFFLAAAFFAFHLLMAYLVDHISIHVAFAICSAVSIFLVVSYLRLVVGMRFAAAEAAGAQFVYLVLFSYAFFFKGFTGLTVTIGAIVSLFAAMQITGRIRWGRIEEGA